MRGAVRAVEHTKHRPFLERAIIARISRPYYDVITRTSISARVTHSLTF